MPLVAVATPPPPVAVRNKPVRCLDASSPLRGCPTAPRRLSHTHTAPRPDGASADLSLARRARSGSVGAWQSGHPSITHQQQDTSGTVAVLQEQRDIQRPKLSE
ncbi:hypothetical protein ZWY2020_021937 [Hordeum vulgare]|nr:hypothetical protein ZWY2020_021937 [Hordeum vulgare]